MLDLSQFNEVMRTNIVKIVLAGAAVIIGNLLFKRLEKKLRKRRKYPS